MEQRIMGRRKCNICGKVIAHTYQIETEKGFEYKTESTSDRFVDKWGYERNFCKKCMKISERKDFWKNIPEDCVKAINELKKLKVYGLIATDYEETFSDVWWLVLHEVDMYEEGEFCQEASRSIWGESDECAMNIRNAQAADRWLVKWLPLFNKYTDRKYYSDDYFKVHSGFGVEPFAYSGQVI